MSDYAPVEPRPGKPRDVRTGGFWVDHADGRVSWVITRRQEGGAPNGMLLAFEGATEAEARERYFRWGGTQAQRVERNAERRAKWGIQDFKQGTLGEEMRAASEPPLDSGADRREPPLSEEPPRLADASAPESSESAAAEPALESAAGNAAPEEDVPRARSSDPPTSHAAAASVGSVSGTQAAILEIFNVYGPMSDDELVSRYQWMSELGEAVPQASESGIRTRRSELVERREVMDLGQVRTLESGRKAIVWGLPRQYDPAKAEIPFPVDPEPPL